LLNNILYLNKKLNQPRGEQEQTINMINEEKLGEIKKIIQGFFKKINFLIEIENLFIEKETIFLKLASEEPKILIGKNGRTLSEIQHLLRIILRKKILENFFFDIDIDDYKKKKIEHLKEMAQETADRVALTRKEKVLEVMSSYERRIIHLALPQRSDVITESVGQEPERRIVIKLSPKN